MLNVVDSPMALALRQAGYRLTRPRLAILQVLQDSAEQLNPYEIHQRGKEIYEQLGLVTVYRTLDLLGTLGLARRVHSKGQCHSYARAEDDKHYLICRGCRRILEFPCDGLDALIEDVRQRTGYAIGGHLLELTGLCPACQGKAED
jgi:Fur family ferric uptake transcriptional regulator